MAGSKANIIELIDKGADVNHEAKSSMTPLFMARTYDTVKLLLDKGADPYKKAHLVGEI